MGEKVSHDVESIKKYISSVGQEVYILVGQAAKVTLFYGTFSPKSMSIQSIDFFC